jgi:hypothetical protein
MVLPDGVILSCGCVAAMDAMDDLAIGHVLERNLVEAWRDAGLRRLRETFGTSALNATCSRCDMYRDLELYRTAEGRTRAALNRQRGLGQLVRRHDVSSGAFAGG